MRAISRECIGQQTANYGHPDLVPPWCKAAIQALGLAFLGRRTDLKCLQI
jgi:hypothetical protein